MTGLLEDIKILDFTRVLAGPHCVKTLQQMGANVVKIEPPMGDLSRYAVPITNGISHYFAQQNAGKRCICINLHFEEGRSIVRRLCEEVDIIVENFRPGTLRYFGLDYPSVVEFNEKIIYASMSGYGQSGAWVNRGAFAPTVQAETGFTKILKEHYGDDLKGVKNDAFSHADLYTALETATAILAALHHRDRTGQGQHIDVAMAATLLAVNERAHCDFADLDTGAEPIALAAPSSPIIGLPDGSKITIAGNPVSSMVFERYCALMRRNDLRDDPRFKTAEARAEHLDELLDEVRSWAMTFYDLRELETQVSFGGSAVGVVKSTSEFLESE